MITGDKNLLAEKLNTLQEVYAKPKISGAAFLIWWDTLKEFDHNDVFTVLGYWANSNSRPPLPNDVWKVCNEKRTEAVELKAAREAASNRAILPFDFRPNAYGREMIKECLRLASNQRKPEGRQGWANKIIGMVECGDHVPYLTEQMARKRIAEVQPVEVDL